ncbi:MAG: dienelactone hydrolase [Betaproteobacteria bacterium]|nr:dienelactone hydrolase [Betaproteobacteria bacterium]
MKPIATRLPSLGLAAVLIFATSSVTRADAVNRYAQGGPHAVRVANDAWRDAARDRSVAVRMYVPQGDGRFPVILFSHGLGGSRGGGSTWGSHWASHGFVSVHLQHPGSDESLWRGRDPGDARRALRAAMSGREFLERNADLAFVIDELVRRRAAGDVSFRSADVARIGMSGHSYGTRTTLALVGEHIGVLGSNPERRIAAAIAFSPAAAGPDADYAMRFGPIAIPFLSITGTADDDVVGNGSTPENRLLPFAHMRPSGKHLLVMREGDHMVFNGVPRLSRLDPVREEIIFRFAKAASTAF